MRVCHLNTCPVGVATQDPELRARFAGRPEHVVNYLYLVAEDVRAHLAELGIPTARGRDRPGRAARPQAPEPRGPQAPPDRPLRPARRSPRTVDRRAPRHRTRGPEPPDQHFDVRELLAEARRRDRRPASRSRLERRVTNVDRTVGARLSHELVARHGPSGLADDTIEVAAPRLGRAELRRLARARDHARARGRGQRLRRQGPLRRRARDPPGRPRRRYVAAENVIIGNVALYGATSGRAFFSGLAGERFAVRNSGALCVVEGVGDHGCEYMTGGRAAILGPTGPQLRRRDERRDRLGPRPRRPLAGARQHRARRPRAGARGDDERDELYGAGHRAPRPHRLARSRRACSSDWEASLAQFVRVIPREYAPRARAPRRDRRPKTSEFRTLAA